MAKDEFAEILANEEDITTRFYRDLGGLPQDILNNARQVKPHLKIVRDELAKILVEPDSQIEQLPALLKMSDWSQEYEDEILMAFNEGQIAAIDGTPVIPHQAFLTGEVFAAGVGSLSSRDHQAHIKLTKTFKPISENPQNLEDVYEVVKNAARQGTSWHMAYMEYAERRYALNHPSFYTIIDGPLVTQNLLTRPAGRQLYLDMFGAGGSKVYLGVIKDIRMSDEQLRFIARALRSGEMYIHTTLRQHLKNLIQRIDAGSASSEAVKIVLDQIGDLLVRGVYKPGKKAFGFECRLDQIRYVVPLLWLRRNPPPHEIPFLLAQVDAALRGSFRPNEIGATIAATLIHEGEEDFLEEENERGLR